MSGIEHIHGGNLTRAALKYGFQPDQFVDFSSNINPLGPPPAVPAAVTANLDRICHYPDPDCAELRGVLAGYLRTRPGYLLMGNGTAELIYLLVRVVKRRRALIPVPTFSEYGLAVLSLHGLVRELPMAADDGFDLPLQQVLDALPGADILFLCNPNNPTGRLIPPESMREILEFARNKEIMVVVDEAFMDFVPDGERFSVLRLVGRYPNLVVLYSLTKFFGIPGLRLGALAATENLVSQMACARDPWSVNVLAQVAGVAALRDREHMDTTRKLIQTEKRFLFAGLSGLPGIKPLPGAANFLLVDIGESGFTSDNLAELTGRRGVLIRDCKSFSGLAGQYIRLAVRTRPENEKLLQVMRQILRGE
ncbi:MAG: threonine-phosphate decarboxylase [Peptococcaceae bacterium]|nr:MAG: threonine-phosphate decarboxylase [Peptococcaceae bacterium]